MRTVTVRRTAIGNRAAAQLGRTERDLINVARQNGSPKDVMTAAGRVGRAWDRLVEVERNGRKKGVA